MMNKLIGLLFVALIAMPACAGGMEKEVSDGGGFNGKIEYTMEYDLPEAYESQRAMLATNMTTYIGKGFTRVEQQTGLGDQITINNLKTGATTILMNLMGQKIALSAEGAERPFEPIIEELEETKTIAGFECKKARYEIADEKGGESTVFEIFYTEAIDGAANTQFPGINGFPMEYVMEAQGMVITYTATKVTEEKVSKDLSKVPSGYEEMSYEDFVKMMGG